MDGSRLSDFSIQRILSPQLGGRPHPAEAGEQRTIPGGASLEAGPLFRAPVTVPVPVPVPVAVPVSVPDCLQHPMMNFGDAFFQCASAFQRADLSGVYPNCGVYQKFRQHPADVQTPACCHGYQQTAASAPTRQKARMRTVFTDGQTRQLEALFRLTDYPSVDARAELARSSGLSEESVRVWFKNRRARRKRQRSGPKSSPSSSPGAPTERTFLPRPSL